ncbi:MAG: hypothetical protein ACLPUO_09135 [Streptosporangiaceae bacterium]|jgi:hypothetical protein
MTGHDTEALTAALVNLMKRDGLYARHHWEPGSPRLGVELPSSGALATFLAIVTDYDELRVPGSLSGRLSCRGAEVSGAWGYELRVGRYPAPDHGICLEVRAWLPVSDLAEVVSRLSRTALY